MLNSTTEGSHSLAPVIKDSAYYLCYRPGHSVSLEVVRGIKYLATWDLVTLSVAANTATLHKLHCENPLFCTPGGAYLFSQGYFVRFKEDNNVADGQIAILTAKRGHCV
jgi:hypothetical protein